MRRVREGIDAPSTGMGPSLKGRALRCLSMREHSRVELARKLAPHAADSEELNTLLDDLTAQGWLSDARAAQGLVRRRSERLGMSRVKQELNAKGLPSDVVAEAMVGLAATEQARAAEVWLRKFGVPPVDAAARAKHMRFLIGRGFGPSTVNAVLRQVAAKAETSGEQEGEQPED